MSPASIVEQLAAYLPPDRVEAVLAGRTLPPSAFGAVLIADISGFTALTASVMRRFGPRRGGEEFTNRLNGVYTGLIDEIERSAGSIIGFAGDAMTVWFDGDDGARATANAFALQQAIGRAGVIVWPDGEEVRLRMKVAVSSGTLRRFQAGDPESQLLDVLAGKVMARVAACEEVALPGEVVVDGRTAGFLGRRLTVAGWRETPHGTRPEKVALATAVDAPPPPRKSLPVPPPSDSADRLRRWILPAVADRVMAGQNVFLTELRPAVALFLRFSGLRFDDDASAPPKLDRFIRWIQGILADLEGALLQLTVGEKGNYLYAVWGAPAAHDDDTRRALLAALALQRPPPAIAAEIGPVEIGIARGTMRTGAYGSERRRTYGVLGDETNLAARLMASAPPGGILVSETAARRQFEDFELRAVEPLRLKGKAEPVAAFQLLGHRTRGLLATLRGVSRQQPMVGRQAELAAILEAVAEAERGEGRIVALEAEAGVGKTRLLAEIVHRCGERFLVCAGDCPVLAREASYAVWIPVWRTFFGVDPGATAAAVLATVESFLERIDPSLRERAPLLGPVLGFLLPDNDLTRKLDPKVRRASLEGLLSECVAHVSARRPVLFVLEECHWIDEASRHLLEALAQAVGRRRMALLLAHRPVDGGILAAAADELFQAYRHVALGDLPPDEARELVELKLGEVYAGTGETVPPPLVELVLSRASGNPFFVEEVANLLQVRRAELAGAQDLETLELPESLHSLVLGRIDQMTEDAQTTLKVASVVGREFQLALLYEVDPLERALEALRPHLGEMEQRGMVLPEKEASEEAYLFRHIVIQEVAYAALPYALRSRLHEAIGEALELRCGEQWQPQVHLLAFHYERSERVDKQRFYLVAAGDASRASYALQPAIRYYERALEVLEAGERVAVCFRLGETLELAGRWDAAFTRYQEALSGAEAADLPEESARCLAAIGDFHRKRGEFPEADRWLQRARKASAAVGDERGEAHCLHLSGTLRAQMGRFDEAQPLFEEALAMRRRLGDDADAAKTLNNLGIVARAGGDVDTALTFYEESLTLRRRGGDRREVANSLNNLGYAYRYRKDFDRARAMLEESVSLNRAVGDRWSTANALTSLAELALDTRDATLAQSCLRESLAINRDLGDRRAQAFLLEAFGHLGLLAERPGEALRFFLGARRLREEIGAPLEPADAEKMRAEMETTGSLLPAGMGASLEAEVAAIDWGRLLDQAAGFESAPTKPAG